ncbi:hypothetical protein IFM89_035891 [Coptis chinensis]|uniref:Uncharacterized protein n=1 Tax=Coptis chinensis TaxID=261450 RepID=A0A835LCM6_9MAGN|nr:hypothetical protein IFM89_035891 [Coptis chinensis]
MKKCISEKYRHFDRHALELLERMMTLDPSQRISAKDAPGAEYFWNDPFLVIPRVYQSTNRLTSSGQRRSVNSSSDSMKRVQSGRNYSIYENMCFCLPFNWLDKCTHSSDLGLTSQCIIPDLQWLQDLATITGSLEDLLEGQLVTQRRGESWWRIQTK